jgi:hypothetical protein
MQWRIGNEFSSFNLKIAVDKLESSDWLTENYWEDLLKRNYWFSAKWGFDKRFWLQRESWFAWIKVVRF